MLARNTLMVGVDLDYVAAINVSFTPPPSKVCDESSRHCVDARLDGAGASHDSGAGILLRRPRALEECPEHDDDELYLARICRCALGGHRLFAGVLRRQ